MIPPCSLDTRDIKQLVMVLFLHFKENFNSPVITWMHFVVVCYLVIFFYRQFVNYPSAFQLSRENIQTMTLSPRANSLQSHWCLCFNNKKAFKQDSITWTRKLSTTCPTGRQTSLAETILSLTQPWRLFLGLERVWENCWILCFVLKFATTIMNSGSGC